GVALVVLLAPSSHSSLKVLYLVFRSTAECLFRVHFVALAATTFHESTSTSPSFTTLAKVFFSSKTSFKAKFSPLRLWTSFSTFSSRSCKARQSWRTREVVEYSSAAAMSLYHSLTLTGTQVRTG
ncbi:hypothetical protein Hamer_G031521, partial [Homarus americanus]